MLHNLTNSIKCQIDFSLTLITLLVWNLLSGMPLEMWKGMVPLAGFIHWVTSWENHTMTLFMVLGRKKCL